MVILGSLLLTTALFFASIEPGLPSASGASEIDLVKYGITQGGLVLVLLVILWFYRRDYGRLDADKEERLVVMTTLVANATAALTQSASATDRMARAIETLQLPARR